MAQSPLQARSLGLKILVVGLIVLLLSIPLMFVNLLSWERAGRADSVRAEVGETYGGSQIFRGPYLILPVLVETPIQVREDGETREEIRRSQEAIIVSADQLNINMNQTSEIRRRAIYDVAVFNADLSFNGQFSVPELAAMIPANGTIQWQGAEIAFAISDLRTIGDDLIFEIEGGTTPLIFEPGTRFDRLVGVPTFSTGSTQLANSGRWQGVAAPLSGLSAGANFSFTGRLELTGADALMVAASGRNTIVSVQSDWPHPSFVGAYLPEGREISSTGFNAQWQVPYLARGVPGAWLQGEFDVRDVDRTAFGVRLFTPTDGYTSVGRSLKYAIFFIGFLMLMFFLIEAASKDRVHAAQYILIGLAQVVFYLLLLAFSEHMATFAAYFTASLATISVTSLYAVTAFRSKARGMATFAVLGVIYAMQYALVLLEDYALLIGAVLAFFAVAMTMYVTRRLNWYELVPEKSAS